ncbi:unnamed protein product [Gordionus sp. m RMFG-2023]
MVNIFKFDKNFETAENKYEEILPGSNDEDSGTSGDEDGSEAEEKEMIVDNTETNLVALRRTIYLTIHSALSHDECAHKLMKMEIRPKEELAAMILDCCAHG